MRIVLILVHRPVPTCAKKADFDDTLPPAWTDMSTWGVDAVDEANPTV